MQDPLRRLTLPSLAALAALSLAGCGGTGEGGSGGTGAPAGPFTIGGTVSGLQGTGGFTLANQTTGNQTTFHSVAGNGAFTLPGSFPSGTPYHFTVPVQPLDPSQICTVANGSGTVSGASVANVAVTCVRAPNLSVLVSGLRGTVAVRNNGAETIPLSANGSHTFPTFVPEGAPYNVTVAAQPSTSPTQTCRITSASSGTIPPFVIGSGGGSASVSLHCTWTKQFGTPQSDSGAGVGVDGTGHVYVAGTTDGSLNGNPSAGGSDVFIVKYGLQGTVHWTVQFGTAQQEQASGIAVDTNTGDVYVSGWTFGSFPGAANAGDSDLFVAKYDSNGVQQWVRQLGSTGSDEALGIATDGIGNNVYVTGRTSGSLDGQPWSGAFDMFLVKYDAAGNQQWTRQFGTPDNDQANAITVDGFGNVYVAGCSAGTLHAQPAAGLCDVAVVKHNSAGVHQWTRLLGTTANDEAFGITTADTILGVLGVYVAGRTFGGLDGNAYSANPGDVEPSDMFIAKYDANGARLWTRQAGTTSGGGTNLMDTARAVAVDFNGGVYVTGRTFGDFTGGPVSGDHGFVLKYSGDGTRLWATNLGAAGETSTSIARSPEDHMLVTGSTSAGAVSGTLGLDGNPGAGGFDAFVSRVDSNGVEQ
jgi:hypothetical protein